MLVLLIFATLLLFFLGCSWFLLRFCCFSSGFVSFCKIFLELPPKTRTLFANCQIRKRTVLNLCSLFFFLLSSCKTLKDFSKCLKKHLLETYKNQQKQHAFLICFCKSLRDFSKFLKTSLLEQYRNQAKQTCCFAWFL